MLRKSSGTGFSAILLVTLALGAAVLPRLSYAVPAFARQMNMPCQTCHFQGFPALNSYGRSFRSSGYTTMGPQPVIEGDDLSLPVNLNLGVIGKLRYKVPESGNNAIEWPDEAALLAGGRAAANTGYLMELGLIGPTDAASSTYDAFLSTKIVFNVAKSGGTQFSVIPFSTDGLGAGYGMELLNTGAQRSQRPIENRKGFSAAQILDLGSGEATGIAFAAANPQWFANYSAWVPGWGGTNTDPSAFAHYFRVAATPTVGAWDTGFGVQYWSGSAVTSTTTLKTDGWVADAQMQGAIGRYPAGFYASYGVAAPGHWSLSNSADTPAYGILGKVSFLPGKAGAYLAYASASGGGIDESKTTLGGYYSVAQNVKLELWNENSSIPGADYTRLMLFFGL